MEEEEEDPLQTNAANKWEISISTYFAKKRKKKLSESEQKLN